MIVIAIILGCTIGAIIGINAPIIPYTYSTFLAIAVIAALDSVFGGITSPYVIKAIGNKSYLESAANSKDGKLKQLQSAGHGVEVQTSSASRPITIGAYTGEIETKYMKDKN